MKRLAYTIEETPRLVPIGKTKIYQLISAGILKTVKIGRRTLITAESLHALVEFHASDEGEG